MADSVRYDRCPDRSGSRKAAKTSIYFNELNEKINEKIHTPKASR
jgi:hypothetical protein